MHYSPPGHASPQPSGSPGRVLARVAGLALTIPALLALLVGYVWPTMRTVVLSLYESNSLRSSFRDPARGRDDEFVGLDNYSTALDMRTVEAYGYALSLAVLPLVAIVLIGPLVAYAAHRAGRRGRWAARLTLTVPMVCLAPSAVTVSWLLDGRGSFRDGRTVLWLTTFGLLVGLGMMLFLAVLRGHRPSRSVWAPTLAVGGIAVLTVGAVTMQSFSHQTIVRADAPMTLAVLDSLHRGFRFGVGAAHSVLLLMPIMLLGVAAVLVAALSNLHLTVEPARSPTGNASPGAWVALVAGLVVVLAVTGYALGPWLSRLGELSPGSRVSAAEVLVNTWLPSLFSTLVGVGLAAVAAFGIGALRPFGRWSELLLLLFAPWLFIGIGPLALVKFRSAADGLFGDRVATFLGLIPPIWVVVPALLVLTLLFKGLSVRQRPDGWPDYGAMVVGALPMLALVAGATWLVQSQSLLWSWLVGTIAMPTGPVLAAMGRPVQDAVGIGLVLPVPVILLLAVALGLLNIVYLDRLAIRTGSPDKTATS